MLIMGVLLFVHTPISAQAPFVRGDSNTDGAVQISDAVFTLSELFTFGTPTTCQDAADANDDGVNDISDAIYMLQFLFASGPVPPLPYPGCGLDLTDDTLDCVTSPCPPLVGKIDVVSSLEWGTVAEGSIQAKQLTISNGGIGALVVESAQIDSLDFEVAEIPGAMLPLTLQAGESRSLTVLFTAPAGLGGTTILATLELMSNDVDFPVRAVALEARVANPAPPLITTSVIAASAVAIDGSNCDDVSGIVKFSALSLATDRFRARLTDSSGASVETAELLAPDGAANIAFGGLDASGLGDGVIAVDVSVVRGAELLSIASGTPTVKNTSPLTAPVLDPLPPVSVLSTVVVCGTAPANTTVSIAGGSGVVSISLDGGTTTFCLTVPLRPNTENLLIASAVSDFGAPPRPVATAAAISVTHVDPSSIVVAEASSVPLTPEEIEELVEAGVIDLDDPDSFSVQMFTIVLTIGSFPVTISQPVPVPVVPGVGYGGGPMIGGGTVVPQPAGGWSPPGSGTGTPSPGTPPASPSGCLTGCSQIVVISTPTGETIPGVIIIDGRIRTLREFFQVTIALFNSSSVIELIDMNTSIELPPGLTPIAAGIGDEVGEVSADGMVEEVFLGAIASGETGIGQFVIRGDVIGTHAVAVTFEGFLGGAAIGDPFPVSGSAATTVEVHGPPHLAVTVSHPSVVGGPDVTFGQIYELLVEITNESAVPALYASLEMYIGGDAVLVDEFDEPIVGASVTRDLGHIEPGQSTLSVFRVQALIEGEIIACQGLTSEGLSLTVDTGPDGTPCAITTAYPADFVPLPADLPPIVLGVSPAPSSGEAPVTTSLLATFTPQADCIEADTWSGIVTALIDPANPGAGIQIVDANLVSIGSFYLEELDPFGNPVRHIPLDLDVENPPAGGTTIAVQRLGLASPLSQTFLSPNTVYRATLVGGMDGICSLASGAAMASDFVWTFSTEQTCTPGDIVTVELSSPGDGAIDVLLNTPIELFFSRRMNPATFGFDPGDLDSSTIGFYEGGTLSGGDLVGGMPIPGTAIFSALNQRLTYSPAVPYTPDSTIHVRVTSSLADICGNPLDTGATAVQIFSFTTPPPDVTPPADPTVSPIPSLTSAGTVQLSGTSEPLSTVTVFGGSLSDSSTTSMTGLYSVLVPLTPDALNTLMVQSADASGNLSQLVLLDTFGGPLQIAQDSTAPTVSFISPTPGAVGVGTGAVFAVEFSESIDPDTVNALNFRVTGTAAPGMFDFDEIAGNRFTFTPDAPLPASSMLGSFLRRNGVRDLAGNGLAIDFTSAFTTVVGDPPSVDSIAPDAGAQGAVVTAVIQGTDLTGIASITIDGSGVQLIDVGTGSDTTRDVQLVIEPSAPPGLRTITVTTPGGRDTVEFTIVEFVSPPAIASVTPSTGAQGTTVLATITGTALDGIVDLTIDGSGVTLVDLGTGDAMSRDVELTIDPTAKLGVRTISLITAGGVANGSFEVVPNAVTLAPTVLNLETRSTGAMTASIPTPAGVGGVEVFLVSGDVSIVQVPSSVVVAEGLTSASFDSTSFGIAGSTTIDASAVGHDSDSIPVTVTTRTFVVTSPLVGIDTTVVGTVLLDSPAPVGGAMLDLSTSNPAVVSVLPASVTIPQGQVMATFELTGGLVVGMATLTVDGLADGYESETINLTVTDRLIDIPGTIEVGLDSTFALPIIIAPDPAPPGGVTLAITSSDRSVAEVLTPTVTIPEGTFSGMASVRSLGTTGIAMVTASEPSYSPDTTTVSVTTELVILQSFLDLPVGESSTVFVELRSGGAPFNAPAGGITVDLVVDDPSCITAPSSILVPAGQSVGMLTISEAPGATLPCTTTLTATSAFGSDSLSVTAGVSPDLGGITFQDVFGSGSQVGERLQVRYRGQFASSAHGGVVVQIQTDDPSRVRLSVDGFAAGSAVIELSVPNGTAFFDFWVQGQPSGIGLSMVTATQSRFTPGSLAYETVPSGLDIRSLTASRTVTSQTDIAADPFSVRSGLPNGSGGLSRFQAVRGGDALSITLTSSNEAVGALQTTTPPQLGDTISVTLPGGSQETATSLATGGPALIFPDPITGTTDVTAAALGFVSDTQGVSVVVNPAALTFPDVFGHQGRIGAGLQFRQRISLSGVDHGGVTVQIDSSDAARAVLSTSSTVAGTDSLSLFLADGQSSVDIWVQGTLGNPGTVTLTATQPLFITGSVELMMVEPVFDVQSLATSHTTTTASDIADDPFRVRVGTPNLTRTAFSQNQDVAPGPPLVVTLTSTDVAVGELVTTAATGAAVTTSIVAGTSTTPSSVATGGAALRFDPPTSGTTTVTATAAGVASFVTDSEDVVVTVNPASLAITDVWGTSPRLGAGLQGRYRMTASGADHGGVTIMVTSSDAGRLLVSDDPLTVGAASVALFLPDGSTIVDFWASGVDGASGVAMLTASESAFMDGTFQVETVQPVLDLQSLALSHTTTSAALIADDAFSVRTGVTNVAGTSFLTQVVSADAGDLTATVTSSDLAIGQLETLTQGPGATVDVIISVNSSSSPSFAGGGVVLGFDPPATGSTVVEATATGYDPTFDRASETVNVTVNPATITLQDWFGASGRVGSGLQTTYRVLLSGADHGGVTVTVASDDDTRIRLSDSATSPGTSSLNLFIPNGQTASALFMVQGVSGATGSAGITASHPAFTSGSVAFTLWEPVLQVQSLASSQTTTTASTLAFDGFSIRTAISTNGTSITQYQAVSGASPLSVSVTSSDPAVAQLETSGSSGTGMVTVVVESGATSTSGSGTGLLRLTFDPTTTGTTAVEATAAGFDPTFPLASQDVNVTVNPATVSILDVFGEGVRLGGGLQSTYRVVLSGPDHGGVNVIVESSDALQATVSTDPLVAGSASLMVFIPDGQTIVDVSVHGTSGAVGNATLTASATSFTSGTLALDLVQPVIRLLNLSAAAVAGGADDPFRVTTGILNPAGTSYERDQQVSAAGPIQVLISNNAAAVADLITTASTGDAVTVEIAINGTSSGSSVATGGVAFRPIAAGTAQISSSAIDFGVYFGSSLTVTVAP